MGERVPELLPCPFCGGPAQRHPRGYNLAHCADETCHPGHVTFALAENWNRRAHADAEKAEAVREALERAIDIIESRPPCPFDDRDCKVKPDEPCPICGDINDPDAPSNCRSPIPAIRALAAEVKP